jgi:hypothetical protein
MTTRRKPASVFFAGIGATLVAASVYSQAQQPAKEPQQPPKESLSVCGHTFFLLSSLADALKAVADSSQCSAVLQKGSDSDVPTYLLSDRSKPQIVYGQLSFLGSRLTSVSIDWDTDVHSDTDYARVLVGLLHKFEEDGCTTYKVRTTYESTPNSDAKIAFLSCGLRQIMLVSSEYKGAKSIQITESLGY